MPSPESLPSFGLVGHVETPSALLRVCERLRSEGYRQFDAHTPFPVHGLDRAMGLERSPLPWIALGAGVVGTLGALGIQLWTMGVDYPQNISGKPLFAFQAYIPIVFEGMVLATAFAIFIGLWWLAGLPRLFHPVMRHGTFERASDDRFFVSIEASDPLYDAPKTRARLEELGVVAIEEVGS